MNFFDQFSMPELAPFYGQALGGLFGPGVVPDVNYGNQMPAAAPGAFGMNVPPMPDVSNVNFGNQMPARLGMGDINSLAEAASAEKMNRLGRLGIGLGMMGGLLGTGQPEGPTQLPPGGGISRTSPVGPMQMMPGAQFRTR